MRRLTLHASALNDEEYELYTASLKELAEIEEEDGQRASLQGSDGDDEYFEKMVLGVREVRAWLRGRYSMISSVTMDTILKYFSPNLSHTDVLSGGQFFAALRLVVHSQQGKDVDRALAFVQAHPKFSASSRPASPQKSQPPHPPPRRAPPDSYQEPAPPPTQYPVYRPDPPSHRASAPVQPHTAHNPFASRPTVPARSEGAPSSQSSKGPPLPPRKPAPPFQTKPSLPPQALVPPPRHSSRLADRSTSPNRFPKPLALPAQTAPASAPSQFASAPAPPPKPVSHVTSNLMKQSLQASKVAQSMKRAEEQLEKERIMQVLKSSSSSAHPSTGGPFRVQKVRSKSPVARPLHAGTCSSASISSHSSDDHRPTRFSSSHRQQQPSPPMSIGSLEQVALATPSTNPLMNRGGPFRQVLPNTDVSTFSSPERTTTDLPSGPPPTHPDRKAPPLAVQTPSTFGTPRSHRAKTIDSFDAVYGHSASPQASPTSSTRSTFPPVTILTTSPSSDSHSPNVRVFRSKSLNQPTPPPPPVPPPPRRKRPESVQVLSRSADSGSMFGSDQPTVDDGGDDSHDHGHSDQRVWPPFGPPPQHHAHQQRAALSRHTSLSGPQLEGHHRSSLSVSSIPSTSSHRADEADEAEPEPRGSQSQSQSYTSAYASPSPLSMKGVLASLQSNKLNDKINVRLEQLHPKLEKARYKAEAGFSKRGFVAHHHSTAGTASSSSSVSAAREREREEEEGLMGVGRANEYRRRREGSVAGSGSGKEGSRDGDTKLNVFGDPVSGNGGSQSGVYSSDSEGEEVWTTPPGGVSRASRSGQRSPVGQDNLKWPVGPDEGWKPL